MAMMTRFPNLKILTHLMGAMTPFFDARIETGVGNTDRRQRQKLHTLPRRHRDGNLAVNRRTQGLLLVGSMVVATVVALVTTLAWGLDHNHCKIGFPTVISCTFEW